VSDPTPSAENPVIRAILDRRSWRIFEETALTGEDLDALQRAAAAAPSVGGNAACRVEIVAGEEAVPAMIRATMEGLVGKTNAWMRSAPPTAVAALIGDAQRQVQHGDRHLYNVDVAVAGEVLSLAAAERGLASTWMSAISAKGIARHLGLADHERVPAVMALGHAGIRRKGALIAAAWDRVSRFSISNRRKSMAEICMLDRFGSGRTLELPDLAKVPDDGRTLQQTVEGLSPAGRFAGEAPDERDLARVLEAMRRAPSAENAQTWRFVVLRGREAVAPALAAAGLDLPADDLPGALIVSCAAPFWIKKVHHEQPFALIDHPIALTHGVLAAEVLGLAWSAIFAFDHEAVRAAVGAPADHPVTAMLALDVGGDHAEAPFPAWVQLWRAPSA